MIEAAQFIGAALGWAQSNAVAIVAFLGALAALTSFAIWLREQQET